MSDLDAIEARSTPRSFYSADGYALLAEVRALREQVATLKEGIEDEARRADNAGLPGFKGRLRALLDDEAVR